MLPSISIILHIILRSHYIYFGDAVEPRYNEEPRDWHDIMYVTTKFHYIRVLFSFSITGVKKIVRYSENLIL